MAHIKSHCLKDKPQNRACWLTIWTNQQSKALRTHRTGSLRKPIDCRKSPKPPGMAHAVSRPTTRWAQYRSSWFTIWANRASESFQIHPDGSFREQSSYIKASISFSLARGVSRSAVERALSHHSWLMVTAIFQLKAQKPSMIGLQPAPISGWTGFKSP